MGRRYEKRKRKTVIERIGGDVEGGAEKRERESRGGR